VNEKSWFKIALRWYLNTLILLCWWTLIV
jgi:hypothetical protein